MITDQPAPVSTSAAVAPAGPVPTITASHSGTTGHLGVGVAARLRVSVELDRAPTRESAVAAVFRSAVRAFARMLVEECAQLALRRQTRILFLAGHLAKVAAERRDPFAID